MNKISIKLKITLWYAILMTLVILFVLGFMFSISGTVVKNDVKKHLLQIVNSNIDEIEFDDGELDLDDDYISYENGIFVYLYDNNKSIINGLQHELPPSTIEFEDGTFRTFSYKKSDYYVYDRFVSLIDYGDLWIRGISSVDGTTNSGLVETIFTLSFITLPFFTIITLIGGYLIAKRSLSPIDNLHKAATAINNGNDLSRRVNVGTGTDEIHTLANTLNQMFDRLETSFHAERQFTSDASHELRTPTSVILAQCEYALEEERSTEEYIEVLEAIERQGYTMSKLISQLLAFTRLEQGTEQIHKELVCVSDLIKLVSTELSELQLKQINIHLNITPNITAFLDSSLITRAINNLVYNAYNYGKTNGNITIELLDDNTNLIINIIDDGIGIADEDISKIWQRFYQVNPSRSKDSSGGMGLGLSMVKQIVELHNGNISCTSNLNFGSKFTIVLPKK